MLNLIFGRAGSGKTRCALETAVEASKNGSPAIVIVPEQFTFETERALVRRFGAAVSLAVEVLSFSRLVTEVMGRYGGLACRYIDDCGRHVLMRLALDSVGDLLGVYRRQAQSASFVKAMVGAVAEYKVCGVDAPLLAKAAQSAGGGLLGGKLSDIALIMRTYCALLDARFADALDDLTRLAQKLDDCPYFEGRTVVLDGFKGFTPQERAVITRMLRQADNVTVTLCAEGFGHPGDAGLFAPVEKTARQIKALADRCGCPVASPRRLEAPHRFEKDALRYLEAAVFRPGAEPYPEDAPDIHVVSAGGVYEEAEFAAREITRLVRETGCRFGDIAVISRGLDLYDGILDPVFEKYGIPLFYDLRRGVASHPLMALTQALLAVMTSGFRQEHVLRYIKTGLAGFTVEEAALLENYALLWGIDGEAQWGRPFEGSVGGFDGGAGDAQGEALARLNALRERVYAPVARLKVRMEQEEKARALYGFLCETGVRERVTQACRELEAAGEAALSREYGQIFEKLVSMLDQISMAAKDKILSLPEFASLLTLVIENTDLGSIPPSLDAVTAGDAERIRTGGARYVFVIGLAEGVFPRRANTGGLISDSERRRLIEFGLELSPPAAEQAAEERFFAYSAFTCASRGVYLSCPRGDATGRAMKPSYFLAAVQKLFVSARTRDAGGADPLESVANDATAFDLLAARFQQKTPLTAALKSIFEEKSEYRGRLSALSRAASGTRMRFSNPATARALYGEELFLSPSRIETFHQCRFLYFCRYGMRALPRKRAELDAPQIGTVIHFVLERLLQKTQAGAGGLAALPDGELAGMTRALLDEFANIYLGGLEGKPRRFQYLFGTLAETVLTLVRHMAEEFAQSGFAPADYELAIARDGDIAPFELSLPGGGRIFVGGKVDRVDTMKLGGKTYLRVVDYKTGVKSFALSDLYYGLNLQMFIYLFTLCGGTGERYGGAVPAGVLYVPAKRPDISAPRGTDPEEIKKLTDRELCMKGIVLGEPDIILGMESGGAGRFIPASVKASQEDGAVRFAVTGRSSVATLEQFGILKRHIEKTLRDMALSLRGGSAAAVPVLGLGYNPCEYCDYIGVCGFEQGCAVKGIYSLDRDEIFEKMEGEVPHGTQLDSRTEKRH